MPQSCSAVGPNSSNTETGQAPSAATGLPAASICHSNSRRSRLIAATVIVIVAAVLAASFDLVRPIRDRYIPKRFGVVEPGKIYRSGQISTVLIKPTLEKHSIRCVVDLTGDRDTPEKAYHDAELQAIDELGIRRVSCPLDSDGTGDVVIYAGAVKALVDAVQAGEPALVHCAAGTQRTGGVVALYRLLVQKQTPAEVLAEMRKYKYNPQRSPKLLAYLNGHMPELATELVRNGAIERLPDELPMLPTGQ